MENQCWTHTSWDQNDDLFCRGVEMLRLGFSAFAYPCPDCGSERRAFFSPEAIELITSEEKYV